MYRVALLFIMMFSVCNSIAQSQNLVDSMVITFNKEEPLFTIQSPNATLISTDDLGNLYVVGRDNTLTRFNSEGDSTGFYRNISNGPIQAVDATNPMRVIVYYARQSMIVLLDRLMAPVTELDLRRINLFAPPAVAYSADGYLWIFDPFNAQLRKVDEQLREIVASNDLRQQTGKSPRPVGMFERNRRLYLNDTSIGILVFDQFASYIATIPIIGASNLQVLGNNLIYQKNNTLYSYNKENFQEISVSLKQISGESPKMVSITRGRLLMLFNEGILVYSLPGGWK